MSFIKYLAEKKYLIMFFAVLMVFICLVTYFDKASRLLDANVAYILAVSCVLFSLYLLTGYFNMIAKLKQLDRLLKTEGMDWANCLPAANAYEHRLYASLIEKLYREASLQLERHETSAREDMEFITAWVHQIKTPISAARLVIENDLPKPSEKTLSSISEELDRIEDFTAKALYYSRANDFAKDYVIESISLDRLVRDSLKRNSKSFIGGQISVSIGDIDTVVLTDGKWTGFILDQIFSNSAKYTGKGGHVSIYVNNDSTGTSLLIKDNGIGIRNEDLERVFEKSFTGFNGRTGRNSTGMGLYLSKRLADKLGHGLSIASDFGNGTTVILHFPRWNDLFQKDFHLPQQ